MIDDSMPPSKRPWRNTERFIVDPDGEEIGEAYSHADGNLMAAAPELLAALTAINDYWNSNNFTRREYLWKPMRDAIAKATESNHD